MSWLLQTVLQGTRAAGVLLHRDFSGYILSSGTARSCADADVLSRGRPFVIPWTVARQAPLWTYQGKNTEVRCHVRLQLDHMVALFLDFKGTSILHQFSLPPTVEEGPHLRGGGISGMSAHSHRQFHQSTLGQEKRT